MKFQFGLGLLLLILGGLDCSWTRVVVAEHLLVNKRLWPHRRDLLDVILGASSSSSVLSSSISSPSISSTPSLSSVPSSTDPSSTGPSSTGPSSTDPSSSNPSGITSALPPTSLGPDPTPTPTSSSPGLLGLLLGPGSDATSSTTAPPSTTTSSGDGVPILGDLLHPGSSSAAPPATSTSSGDGVPILGDLLHGSSSTAPPATTSSSGDGVPILGDLLHGSSSTVPPATTTSSGDGVPILGDLLHGSSSTAPPATTTSSGDGVPILGDLLHPGSSSSASPPLSEPPLTSSEPGLIPLPSIVTPILNPSPSSGSGEPTTAVLPPTSILPIPLPGPSVDPSPSPPPPSSPILSLTPSADPPPGLAPSLDLPTPTPTPTPTPSPSPSPPQETPTTTQPPTPPTPRPTTTPNSVSINSDLSFVLTESSLAVASLPSSSNLGNNGQSLTDPDAATTTITNTQPLAVSPLPSSVLAASNSGPSNTPRLPVGVPSRIYPASQQVQPGVSQGDMAKDGYTLISILFDQQLNWPFVVNSPISSSQIFAFVPALVSTAIGDPSGDNVKTLFLQVYIPTTYISPEDQLELGTLWVGYIPTDQVDTLEAMIKAKQSKFYTGVPIEAAKQLAARVRGGWRIRGAVGVGDDSSSSGGSGSGSSGSGSSAGSSAGDQQKTRRDAIVGVVSSLGAIAVLVLAVLIVHSVKRRRELAHRRLVDRTSVSSSGSSGEDVGAQAPGAGVGVGVGVGSGGGREFDRDSVGAPRRRSFYYAEDSLRGWEAERDQTTTTTTTPPLGSPGVMTQRKVGPVVVPGSISAPILRESSMNW